MMILKFFVQDSNSNDTVGRIDSWTSYCQKIANAIAILLRNWEIMSTVHSQNVLWGIRSRDLLITGWSGVFSGLNNVFFW